MKNKKPIIVYISGGLGNQMFQYAFGKTLSIRNDTSLKLDISLLKDQTPRSGFTLRQFDLDVFNIEAEVAVKNEIPFLYRRFFTGKTMAIIEALRRKIIKNPGKENQFQFDQAKMNLDPGTYLEGYWQSPKYFSGSEKIIRKDFTLKSELSDNSLQLQKEITSTVSVCMHIRRGDYVGNTYHDIGLNKEYYDKGLEYISHKVKIGTIYVFSDDIDWCKNNLTFTHPTIFVPATYAGKKNEEHLILMSSCKHFIIPNSSFSWWAAWLSSNTDKIVIAPKQWFADKNINTSDLIPSEWIRI